MNLKEKKTLAEQLFVRAGFNQKSIVAQLKISAPTLKKWIEAGQWKEMKAASSITKGQLIRNCYEQLLAIDQKIKDLGNIPTKELADAKGVLRKTLETLSDSPLHHYTEVMSEYIGYLQTNAPTHLKKTIEEINSFINFRKEKGESGL